MARKKQGGSEDVALLYAPTDDGRGARVLRARGGALEAGEVRPMKEGRPVLGGEVVRLTPRAEAPCVCDVEVMHEGPPRAESSGEGPASPALGRPAQVATDEYRANWDRVFGVSTRAKRDQLLN